jgi:uncharacterized protein (TIGR00730 family)
MPVATESQLGAKVAVFGSSEPLEPAPLYQLARSVGSLLAQAGYDVVSGGYGGVMEGVSRGARDAGGRALGVTTSAFQRGGGNRYLSEETTEKDLFLRTRALIEVSSAYIILPGKAGTLAELTFLWALQRAGLLEGKPVVLLGAFWNGLVEDFLQRGLLEPAQAGATAHVLTPEEAVEQVHLGIAN